jgi:hypothetical protein
MPPLAGDVAGPGALRSQRREWRAQRAVWAGLALFLLLAVAGLFGSGPLAEGRAEAEAGGIRVVLEHPRWTRYGYPEALDLRIEAPGAEGDLAVRFSGRFVEKAGLEDFEPPADAAVPGEGSWTATWGVEDWSRPVEVALVFRSEAPFGAGGAVEVRIGDRRGPVLPFEVYVHP